MWFLTKKILLSMQIEFVQPCVFIKSMILATMRFYHKYVSHQKRMVLSHNAYTMRCYKNYVLINIWVSQKYDFIKQ